jgi:hypothetical protein
VKKFSLLLVFLFFLVPVLAQNGGPSLEETTAWIVQKINGNSIGTKWYEPKNNPKYGEPWGATNSYRDAQASGCSITYKWAFWSHYRGEQEEQRSLQETLDFSKMVGNSAHVEMLHFDHPYADLRVYDKQYPENYYKVVVGLQGKNDGVAVFSTSNRELAPRMANAVNHAVELCGGKPEVF